MADPNFDFNDPVFKAERLSEMEKEWEKDWAALVANTRANGFAWLISADEQMRKHYPRTVW